MGLWMGMALMLIWDVETAGCSATVGPLGSFFPGAVGLTVVSLEVDRCGIFRISLYRDCLQADG